MSKRDDDMHAQRVRNLKLGLIVGSIAFALFLSIIVRTWFLRDG
jgi:hypothetical protein